jgi:hypothetical protein
MTARTRSSRAVLVPGLSSTSRPRITPRRPVALNRERVLLLGESGDAVSKVENDEKKVASVAVVVSGLPLSVADLDQWKRFMTTYIDPRRRAQLVKLVRDHSAVLRAVEHNYKEMFGVQYTERAKESQLLDALDAIGNTRSVARALLISLAPSVELRSVTVTKGPTLKGSTLDDLFVDYPVDDRTRVLTYLALQRVETPAELRELIKLSGEDTRPPASELWEMLGSDYYEREERGLKLKASLGLRITAFQREQLERYERRRRSQQQEKIERDVWRPWLALGARVPTSMFVSYVDRRRTGGDELPFKMNGTVVHTDAKHKVVAVRLDAETPETKESRQTIEARSNIQLIIPYERTFAFVYQGRRWTPNPRKTNALPLELKTDNSNFMYARGCIALPRDMIETLVDTLHVGTNIEIQKRTNPGSVATHVTPELIHVTSSSAGTEETKKTRRNTRPESNYRERKRAKGEPEESANTNTEEGYKPPDRALLSHVRGIVVNITRGVNDTSTELKTKEGRRCNELLPHLRVRTLTKPPQELEFSINVDLANYSMDDLYMSVRDCLHCRMPVLSTDEHGPGEASYFIDLVPSVAQILREFRDNAPPAISSAENLWQLVEQFI